MDSDIESRNMYILCHENNVYVSLDILELILY